MGLFSAIMVSECFPKNKPISKNMSTNCWLVVSTPLKNISQLGLLFPIYGKIKFMFQTTNQIEMSIANSKTDGLSDDSGK
jgi:hypothetical protein